MTIQGQHPITDATAMTNQVASSMPTAATSKAATSSTATPSIDGLATENTFLQLLVAQIKNQDPTNPTDSVQFLSQLAQFSQLEQLIGIRQELKTPGSSTTSDFITAGPANATVNNSPWLSIAVNGTGTFRFNVPYRVTATASNGMGLGDFNGNITITGSSFTCS